MSDLSPNAHQSGGPPTALNLWVHALGTSNEAVAGAAGCTIVDTKFKAGLFRLDARQ